MLAVILMHASLVTATLSIVPLTLSGVSLLTWLLVWGAVLWMVVVIIALVNGGKLSANHSGKVTAPPQSARAWSSRRPFRAQLNRRLITNHLD